VEKSKGAEGNLWEIDVWGNRTGYQVRDRGTSPHRSHLTKSMKIKCRLEGGSRYRGKKGLAVKKGQPRRQGDPNFFCQISRGNALLKIGRGTHSKKGGGKGKSLKPYPVFREGKGKVTRTAIACQRKQNSGPRKQKPAVVNRGGRTNYIDSPTKTEKRMIEKYILFHADQTVPPGNVTPTKEGVVSFIQVDR